MPIAIRLCIEIMCFIEKITIGNNNKYIYLEKEKCWHLLESLKYYLNILEKEKKATCTFVRTYDRVNYVIIWLVSEMKSSAIELWYDRYRAKVNISIWPVDSIKCRLHRHCDRMLVGAITQLVPKQRILFDRNSLASSFLCDNRKMLFR